MKMVTHIFLFAFLRTINSITRCSETDNSPTYPLSRVSSFKHRPILLEKPTTEKLKGGMISEKGGIEVHFLYSISLEQFAIELLWMICHRKGNKSADKPISELSLPLRVIQYRREDTVSRTGFLANQPTSEFIWNGPLHDPAGPLMYCLRGWVLWSILRQLLITKISAQFMNFFGIFWSLSLSGNL